MRNPASIAKSTLAGLAALAMLTGCTDSSSTTPPDGAPAADASLTALAKGLSSHDLSAVPLSVPASAAQKELDVLVGGMDGLRPTVTPGQVSYDHKAGTATAQLAHRLPLGSQTWDWTSTATLELAGQQWRVRWEPQVVQPDLDASTRLRHTRDVPTRAAITGADGQALVEQTTAWRVGVDKSVPQASVQTTARTLAQLVDIDADAYAKRVSSAGPSAFVPAITLRQGKVPAAAKTMPGVAVLPVELPLAPSASFAVGILGGAGEASAEQVAKAKGDVLPGDIVGTSGLQARHDARLRGAVGHTVEVVRRSSPTPSPTTSPTDQTGASPSPSASPVVKRLFTSPAKPGSPVATSLDRTLQERAEKALSGQKGIASLVVVKVGTGDVLAAATSTATGGQPVATQGHFAPGSTFKVASSLALLRKGLTPTSPVPCTKQVTVNGRVFTNYSDFPASKVGTITLSDALANSCNTAFIAERERLDADDLAQAAQSLGMGVDHDAGFGSFFGAVPTAKDPVTKAADMIGQGTVEASPMAMAGVAASVASGHTVVPWLVAEKKPTQKEPTLTPAEASQLQALMKAVVSDGSGKVLAGQMTGAKTGTAEYGTATPPRTHAWMIAWNGQYAVSAMVHDGRSGSQDAAPVIKAFLSGA
ncbi:penicillin-binding transpeptidase domain-containing protein [Luteococcus sediminum]